MNNLERDKSSMIQVEFSHPIEYILDFLGLGTKKEEEEIARLKLAMERINIENKRLEDTFKH